VVSIVRVFEFKRFSLAELKLGFPLKLISSEFRSEFRFLTKLSVEIIETNRNFDFDCQNQIPTSNRNRNFYLFRKKNIFFLSRIFNFLKVGLFTLQPSSHKIRLQFRRNFDFVESKREK
jgi:hypothetical protein